MAKSRKPKKVKADDHLKEAIVLIPLTYNDGTQIAPQIIDSICEEIFDVFHGWTMEGKVKGAYRMRSTGQKQVEDLLKVSIVLETTKVSKLEEMVGQWCMRLGQEVMLLKIADLLVKFVPPQPEREEP